MPVSIRCPNPKCGKVSLSPESVEGKRVRCKGCGTAFVAATVDGSAHETFTPTRPVALETPKTVGRFQVRSRLGAGAFGVVYRAYDPQLDREVALKVPNAAVMDSPKRVERFLREAKAAAGLRHPHIVPVFDAGKDGERYFIASAFIDGKKLADTFDENGTDPRRAARLVRELAEALAYAHEQGVVHRDVKPDNIMVDADDRVHLMDFGLASRQDEESRLTNDGAVMGTPSYMAPEQAKGQEGEARAAADQYSAGVVLYELLTGRLPFEGPPAVVMHNHIHTEPERPGRWRAGLPRDLETVCLKALAKRPEERYAGCQAMADDLRRWLEGEPIAARPLGAVDQLTRWARKNRAVAMLSGAVAVCLVLGVVASSLFAVWAAQAATEAAAEAANAREAIGRERKANEEARAAQREAEQQTEEAKKARDEVENQRLLAVNSAEEARKAQKTAEDALAAASRSEGKAVKSDEEARRETYFTLIEKARKHLETGNYSTAESNLRLCHENQRGWEWELLSNWSRAGNPPYRDSQIEAHKQPAKPSVDGTIVLHAYDRSGTRFACAMLRRGWDKGSGVVTVWDLEKRQELTTIRFVAKGSLQFVELSADGSLIAVGTGDLNDSRKGSTGPGNCYVWDVVSGERQTLEETSQQWSYESASFDPGNHTLALNRLPYSKEARGKPTSSALYDIKTWKPARLDDMGRNRLVFSPSGKWLASFEGTKLASYHDPRDGRTLMKEGFSWNVSEFDMHSVSDDGSLMAALKGLQTESPSLVMLDGIKGVPFASVKLPAVDSKRTTSGNPKLKSLPSDASGAAPGALFSSDGKKLAIFLSTRVYIYESSKLELVCTIEVDTVYRKRHSWFSADGKYLWLPGSNSVRLWDAATGRCRLSLSTPGLSQLSSLMFSSDGKRMIHVSGSHLRIWQIPPFR